MEDFGAVVAFFMALAAIVFVLWVIAAVFMRILAILVFYWIGAFALGAVAGLITGLLLPLRVLSGRAAVKPDVASPDKVVENKVMKIPPRGMQKHFGWDNAWPVYNPYQARLDALAVISETRAFLATAWTRTKPKASTSTPTANTGKAQSVLSAVVTTGPGFAWLAIAAAPTAGFVAATWVSIGFWLLVMLVFGGVVYAIQVSWVTVYRWWEKLGRRRARASLKCHVCYRETDTPSYKCRNPTCTVVHRDISPGPLGMLQRRCSCGTGLPTTVGKAAKVLEALCPFCANPLAEGAGTRQTVQIPVIGTVGAGKTRLLATTVVGLEAHLASRSGVLVPLSDGATEFLTYAKNVTRTSQKTDPTAVRLKPEGLPYRVETDGRSIELHMMDAAGESFTSMDRTQALSYIDTAGALLLVLDPLAFEDVNEEARRRGTENWVAITSGDQEDAYASVVDRLRAENVDLRRKHLAVVLTKTDVLQSLSAGLTITPGDSRAIRQWLDANGEDGLVRRIEDDFENVTYFAVDSMDDLDLSDPRNPIAVLQWVLDVSNTKVSILAVPAAAPAN
ncbi:TRAFAC clade GTPase domain-containing protein [Rhodococcus pyridinivorans]|uniref:TRAFAC clade GTPase domain-containing protein n=1 Tax=Rhodococcus pyridinivorans TaxID=103816 RepID=UPI0020791477|nr:hypothetical protein [Rhodococcus pyridinivorans]USI89652.1 hypothetical protein LLA01_19090 [Rhodococcus pyridinivorans]